MYKDYLPGSAGTLYIYLNNDSIPTTLFAKSLGKIADKHLSVNQNDCIIANIINIKQMNNNGDPCMHVLP